MTGYGNIATAVRAVKLGAVDYLTKPADMDDIISILLAPKGVRGRRHRVRCRRLKCAGSTYCKFTRIFGAHNVSETSRRLKMHRRTLQLGFCREAEISSLVECQTKGPGQPFEQVPVTPLSDSPSDPEEAATMVGCYPPVVGTHSALCVFCLTKACLALASFS